MYLTTCRTRSIITTYQLFASRPDTSRELEPALAPMSWLNERRTTCTTV